MKRRFDELDGLRVEIPANRRHQQLAVIEAELRGTESTAARQGRSRRLAPVLVAVALAIPAAAIASDDSVPGDLLYPVKQIVEPLWSLLDGEVEARHRVDELVSLVDSNAEPEVVDRQIERTREALAGVDAPSLQRRFDRVVDRLDGGSPPLEQPARPDQPAGPSDTPTTTTTEVDSPTTTRRSDEIDPVRDQTTTTAAVPGDSDRPPVSDRPPADG